MNRMTLIIGGVVVAALVGAGVFLGPQLLGGGEPAEAGAEAEVEHEPGSGEIVEIPERIVNLAPGGDQSFAKIQFALEFDVELESGGEGDPSKEFKKEVSKLFPVLEDRINLAIAERTSTDLATSEGKASLKEEILEFANELFGEEHPVTFVYISQFVMQ